MKERGRQQVTSRPAPQPPGVPITDELVAKLAKEADAGYDVEEIVRRRGGRPPMGSTAARVESVRLDPELQTALTERDHATTSTVIRKALREYLNTSPHSPQVPGTGR